MIDIQEKKFLAQRELKEKFPKYFDRRGYYWSSDFSRKEKLFCAISKHYGDTFLFRINHKIAPVLPNLKSSVTLSILLKNEETGDETDLELDDLKQYYSKIYQQTKKILPALDRELKPEYRTIKTRDHGELFIWGGQKDVYFDKDAIERELEVSRFLEKLIKGTGDRVLGGKRGSIKL